MQRAGVSDATRLRQLMLLKIAQDCLRLGYVTFAFTSVGVPKPHLPNKPPDAPPEFASTQTFNPPTSHVPQIEPGTMVGVKFFKAGDPGAADSLYAEMIVASLGPTLQR